MNINIERSPSENLTRFKESLLINREEMEGKRNLVSDVEYGKTWWISGTTILKHMWKVDKHLYNGMPRIKMDVKATNLLRWTYRDKKIAKMLKCSNASIQKYCGTRRDNWIPHISASHIVPDVIPNLPPAIKRADVEKEILLKQDNWIYKVDKPYWDTSSEVQLYNWPHPYLREKIA